MCNTTTAVSLFLYRRARRTSSSFRLSLLVFSRSRFASLFRDASRLCRHSALVSAGLSSLASTRLCSGLFSALLSVLVSGLVALLLFVSASATPLICRLRLLQYWRIAAYWAPRMWRGQTLMDLVPASPLMTVAKWAEAGSRWARRSLPVAATSSEMLYVTAGVTTTLCAGPKTADGTAQVAWCATAWNTHKVQMQYALDHREAIELRIFLEHYFFQINVN